MLYLRRERETLEEIPASLRGKVKPSILTRAYADSSATQHVATWPANIMQPHKNSKTVVINCNCYSITWIFDKN